MRVPFGIISNSFLLAAVLIHHVRNYEGKLPEINERNIYVDDVIVPTNSKGMLQEALGVAKEYLKGQK